MLLDQRIVIPTFQRAKVLRSLHSAHQGEGVMKARANESIYWSGMNTSIRNTRASCTYCSKTAPSQPKEPINLTPSPDWPFQQIAMDFFHVGNHGYLACADIPSIQTVFTRLGCKTQAIICRLPTIQWSSRALCQISQKNHN